MTSYLFGKTIGYKKLRDDRIAELEIYKPNNEKRYFIHDSRYAKMRCASAKVLDIYSVSDFSKKFTTGNSEHDYNFIYTVGQIVTAVYDSDPNSICAGGIHYFLDREAAIGYNHRSKQYLRGFTGYLVITIEADGSGAEREYYKNGQYVYSHIILNQKIVNSLSFLAGVLVMVAYAYYLMN